MDYMRQGDICIIPIARKSKRGLRKVERDNGRIILAYGEVTGHAHAILDPDVDLYEETSETADAVDLFLRVGRGGAVLVHEEHGPISLPKGDYAIRHQREYHPEEIRRVAD